MKIFCFQTNPGQLRRQNHSQYLIVFVAYRRYLRGLTLQARKDTDIFFQVVKVFLKKKLSCFDDGSFSLCFLQLLDLQIFFICLSVKNFGMLNPKDPVDVKHFHNTNLFLQLSKLVQAGLNETLLI